MQLVVASHNQGKVKEIAKLLQLPNLELLALDDVGIFTDVEETGQTFWENALLKADDVCSKTNLASLADDSGLEISHLNGLPGVNSKRWIEGTDQDRNIEILRLLENVKNRQARFVSVICFIDSINHKPNFFEGVVTGKISSKSEGLDGFGYDPIFIPDGYSAPFSKLGLEIKNKISHRAVALRKVKEFLYARYLST